jgi:hypothetical protein
MKTIIVKALLLTTVFLLMTNMSSGQKKRYPVHELSVSTSGGLSGLLYSVPDSKQSLGFGGSLELGYTYNLKRDYGIVTGFGISFYTGSLDMPLCHEAYTGADDLFEGYTYTLDYSLTGYGERHSITLFTIPVMFRYLMGAGKTRYFLSGGMKIGIPLGARAAISPGILTVTGRYEYEQGEYADLPQHGFVTDRPIEETDYKLKLGVTPSFALETGARFPAGYKKDLQVGVYLNYSPFDARKSSDRHVVEYQPDNPHFYTFNSILNTAKVNKLSLLSAGIKVGISF